jgi:hypothetical protein
VRKEQPFSALVGCFLPARLMPTITAKVHKIPEPIHVLLSIRTTTGTSYMTCILKKSPPKDEHLSFGQCFGSGSVGPVCFWPPGSVSGCISQRYGSRSFCHQAKIRRKTLIPTVFNEDTTNLTTCCI